MVRLGIKVGQGLGRVIVRVRVGEGQGVGLD